MSDSPKVSLLAIEKAIRANCVVDNGDGKRLSLKLGRAGQHNKSIGRTLFIYFGLQAGHECADIANFLECLPAEWESCLRQYEELYFEGKRRFERNITEDEIAAFFYRKLRLVANALGLSCYYQLEKQKVL